MHIRKIKVNCTPNSGHKKVPVGTECQVLERNSIQSEEPGCQVLERNNKQNIKYL